MKNKQNTLAKEVKCVGYGVHSNKLTELKISPAEPSTGIVFIRTDITDRDNIIPALFDNVIDTSLCTKIANKENVSVSTIEHLMAALWGCDIDNAIIKINGPEVPIMDGSSEPFVFMIECGGRVEQNYNRKIIEILEEISVQNEKGSSLSVKPFDDFNLSVEIEFDNKIIGKQVSSFESKINSFKTDFSRARTFGFLHEAEYLRSKGLALGASLENAIVIDQDKILNEDKLRYENEFAKHKLLDAIGDLYLAGAYIKGNFTGIKPGHYINNLLLKKIFDNPAAWRYA